MSFIKIPGIFPRKHAPQQRTEISAPLSVTKHVHVVFNQKTNQFSGLPPEWEDQVKNLFP